MPQALDAHSRSFLERTAAAAAAVPAAELTPQRRRTLMREANAMLLPPEGALPMVREELQLPLSGRDLPARVYRPQAGALADVLLVFFHGGGWVVGDLQTHDNACAFLADRLGCTLLSVEYRKAPEHPFPAPCDDAQEAYAWAWAQRARFGATRIAVAGDSAGGQLAALAMHANTAVPTAAALLFYPVADRDFGNRSYTERGGGPGLTSAAMVWFWEQFVGAGPLDARAVALRQDWTRTPPPTVVTLAWHDPLHDEGLAYARHLERAGGRTALLVAEDMAHGFLRQCRANASARAHTEQAADALASLLQRG